VVLLLNIKVPSNAWRVHFRHLSRNEPHRLAFEPFIDFPKLENCAIWDDCTIMVCEERISVEFFDFGGPYETGRMAAAIIDWTTGQILLVGITNCVPLIYLLRRPSPIP
jgi:hypothetical protein